MISRRSFLLGTSAGFVLPAFYNKALAFLENHGEPLLTAPRRHSSTMYACPDLDYSLFIGDPHEGPPDITVQNFYRHYVGVDDVHRYLIEEEGYELDELPALSESMYVWQEDYWFETWQRSTSPNALAHGLLSSLDLGPESSRGNLIGELEFFDCPCPGSDYLGVKASDELSVSLLQARLNELRTGVRVEMCKC